MQQTKVDERLHRLGADHVRRVESGVTVTSWPIRTILPNHQSAAREWIYSLDLSRGRNRDAIMHANYDVIGIGTRRERVHQMPVALRII